MHKTDWADIVVNLFNADGLAGKDLTEVDFLGAQTDSAATGNHDGCVVEGVVDVGQSLIEAGGGLIDFGRILHAVGFVRALVIKDLDEFVEPGLLLQEVGIGRLGSLFLQGEMRRSWRPFCCGWPGLMRSMPIPRRSQQSELAQIK